MGVRDDGGSVYEQSDIERKVVGAIRKLKCGKASGIYGITAEMKYGGNSVLY